MRLLLLILPLYVAGGVAWFIVRGIWRDALDGVRERFPNDAGSPVFMLAAGLGIIVGAVGDLACWPFIEWKIQRYERAKRRADRDGPP
jgi:hypothetical protein